MSLLILQPVAKYRHPLNQLSLDSLEESGVSYKLITATGSSEIVRARCILAEMGMQAIRKHPRKYTAVFWLDADMVFEPELVKRHQVLAITEHLPIAGLYPQRIKDALAMRRHHSDGATPPGFLPVLSGMGALMVPTALFEAQYNSSELCADPNMRRIICPMLTRPYGDGSEGVVLISEDFSYCLSFFERDLGAPYAGVYTPTNNPLNYGHVAEKVLIQETGLEEEKQ